MNSMTTDNAIGWLEWVSKASNDWLSIPVRWDVQSAVKMAKDAIKKVSATGHWTEDIDKSRGWDWRRFYCSECGDWQTHGKSKYCPNCGVKMEVDNEDT